MRFHEVKDLLLIDGRKLEHGITKSYVAQSIQLTQRNVDRVEQKGIYLL